MHDQVSVGDQRSRFNEDDIRVIFRRFGHGHQVALTSVVNANVQAIGMTTGWNSDFTARMIYAQLAIVEQVGSSIGLNILGGCSVDFNASWRTALLAILIICQAEPRFGPSKVVRNSDFQAENFRIGKAGLVLQQVRVDRQMIQNDLALIEICGSEILPPALVIHSL